VLCPGARDGRPERGTAPRGAVIFKVAPFQRADASRVSSLGPRLAAAKSEADEEWLVRIAVEADETGDLSRSCLVERATTFSGREKGERAVPSHSEIAAFDSTLQTTFLWLNELNERLGWTDHRRAYHALSAVLHALRDRLSVDEAAALGAQLPLLIRGVYYQGWHPAGKPLKVRTREEFLDSLQRDLAEESPQDRERIARAVFQVVAKNVSPGEAASIAKVLPEPLRQLWPK
jgi:uncharacterized protein (DUF2267 family)